MTTVVAAFGASYNSLSKYRLRHFMFQFNIKNIGVVLKILRRETKKYRQPIVSLIANRSGKNPFLILISCILSLRTQDRTTAEASKRLFKLASTPRAVLKLSKKKIERAIYPVGFFRVKARTIKDISRDLINRFKGKVPDTLDSLLSLKGVGRKTANLVLTEAFNKLGICVDTHVHRISNRLGLTRTKSPKETEFALRKVLPKLYWKEFNYLLVTYGQNLCKPVSPSCSICKINSYCPKLGVKK